MITLGGSVTAAAAGQGFGCEVQGNVALMAQPAPVGSDVSAGTYRCTNCGFTIGLRSTESLPPCPKCDGPYAWEALSGGDSVRDPYPDGR